MSWSRLERFAPLSGVLAVALWVLGVIVIEVIGNPPDDSAPAADFVTYYDEDGGSIFGGSILIGIGVAAFLWFLGSLRSALRTAEGGTGRLSAVSFGAGIGLATLLAAFVAPDVAGAAALDYLNRDLSSEAAETLSVLGDGFLIMAFPIALAFFAATAVVVLKTRVLPIWLGWATLVLAVLMITPISWIFFLLGIPVWTLVVSVLLYLKGAAAAREPAAV